MAKVEACVKVVYGYTVEVPDELIEQLKTDRIGEANDRLIDLCAEDDPVFDAICKSMHCADISWDADFLFIRDYETNEYYYED